MLSRIPRSLTASSSSTFFRCASSNAPAAPVTGVAHTPKPSHPTANKAPSSIPAELKQSPNVPTTWSTDQNPKYVAMSGPRFEQTDMTFQPNPLSAMGMVAQDPIRLVDGRKATCDGGGGPLGHPKIYINLDKPGPKPCGYCGIRFEQAHHKH